jgi:membrane-associated phospholipid phosphatase
MTLLLLVIVATAIALAAGTVALRRHPARGAVIATKHDPQAVTGLALTLALVVCIGGGLLLGVLAYLVRGDSGLVRWDNSVAEWGQRHASGVSTDVLEVITHLGEPTVVAVLAVVVAAVETARTRSRWVVPFVLVVVAGNGLLTTTVKQLSDRVRPALNPIAETLGPSFPSGHSSWSAAFFAAAALLLSRGRSRRTRAIIAGVAAGLVVLVAGSRVLLGVHWLSDVIAGIALGSAWFCVCAIAFGGRLLRFGAPVVETADAAADPGARGPSRAAARSPRPGSRPSPGGY